jgi:hypothetical protein
MCARRVGIHARERGREKTFLRARTSSGAESVSLEYLTEHSSISEQIGVARLSAAPARGCRLDHRAAANTRCAHQKRSDCSVMTM